MALTMICKVVFPATETRSENIIIRRVESITIESGWELLTDTATITMARNIPYFRAKNVRDIFKHGDPVTIWMGYNDERYLKKEFTGYISQLLNDIPLTIKCEDEMYRLKQHAVNYAMKSNSLQDLIGAIVPKGMAIDVADMELSKSRFPNTTAAQVLEKLQESNIYSYFKGKTLMVGKIYSDDIEAPVLFNFAKNVVDHNLNYRLKENILILIRATSTLPFGKKLIAEFGDPGGIVQNLSYYNISNRDALRLLCQQDYQKFKVDSYKGDLTAFGIPSVRHGMKAKIENELYPERNGVYWIKHVTKNFDINGYHQVLTLDQKST